MSSQTQYKHVFSDPKDPDEVLDFKWDFAALTNEADGATEDYLASGETISSKTVTAQSGITVDSSSITDSNTSVTVWLSEGTAGTDYEVECKVVTSASRTVVRTGIVQVRER